MTFKLFRLHKSQSMSWASDCLALLFAVPAVCLGQSPVTLGISSGAVTLGNPIALNINLTEATPDPPVALQWTLNYSTTDFSAATVTAGSAATAANKSVSCNNTAGSITCQASGLSNAAISSGVVAVVSLTASSSTTNASSLVQLTNTVAADAMALSLGTSTSNGTITLQP